MASILSGPCGGRPRAGPTRPTRRPWNLLITRAGPRPSPATRRAAPAEGRANLDLRGYRIVYIVVHVTQQRGRAGTFSVGVPWDATRVS